MRINVCGAEYETAVQAAKGAQWAALCQQVLPGVNQELVHLVKPGHDQFNAGRVQARRGPLIPLAEAADNPIVARWSGQLARQEIGSLYREE